MKNSPWYNLVFMFIITAVLTGILSGIYEFTKPKIETNEAIGLKKAYLSAFGIDYPGEGASEDIEKIYDEQIKLEKVNDVDTYIAKDDEGNPFAYGFTFTGGALWGEVEGIVVLTPDLKNVIGIEFTEQNETPGLGGRIGEPEYKEQFRGVELNSEGYPLVYNTSSKAGQVDAITGATLTSNSVLDIVNGRIEEVKKTIGGDEG